jgi:hypothetical protein
MSTQRIPRRSPRKHPASVKVRARKEVAKWVPDHELQLLYILLDNANIGIISPYKQEFIMEVTNKLNILIRPHHFTWAQVKTKIKNLKATYTNFFTLLKWDIISGFGWDPVTNVVSTSDMGWKRLKYVRLVSYFVIHYIC